MLDSCTMIIAGGSFDVKFADRYLSNHTYQHLIAVDNGLYYANQAGLTPDWIVGDFDTVSADLLLKYENNPKVKIHRLNPHKDATDTQVALELALQNDSKNIVILGGLGGRFDHTLGNLQMLYYLLQHKVTGYLINEINKVYLIQQKTVIRKKEQYGKYVSLLPFDSAVQGVTLEGFQYPLSNYELPFGSSLGISNEIVKEEGVISLNSGTMVVIESKDK